MTWSYSTKNNSPITYQPIAELTWDEANFTWDNAGESTWDKQSVFTPETKHSSAITYQPTH